MLKKLLQAIIFIPVTTSIAYADQLVIKDSRGNAQSAYTLQTENLETCIETAKNISNLDKFEIKNYNRSSISSLEYLCFKGTKILKHGYIYQIPVDEYNNICLKHDRWNGIELLENCLPESKAILLEKSLYHYLIKD